MTELITELRGWGNAGTADYSVAGVTYWSDDQLQEVLDHQSSRFDLLEIPPVVEYSSGAPVYKDYLLPFAYAERDLEVLKFNGDAYGTALYSIDYVRGVVSFASNTGGSAVYVSGHAFDLYRSAADVWRQKAAHYASAYDISGDGQSLKRSQLMSQCLQMAAFYEGRAGVTSVSIRRGDE